MSLPLSIADLVRLRVLLGLSVDLGAAARLMGFDEKSDSPTSADNKGGAPVAENVDEESDAPAPGLVVARRPSFAPVPFFKPERRVALTDPAEERRRSRAPGLERKDVVPVGVSPPPRDLCPWRRARYLLDRHLLEPRRGRHLDFAPILSTLAKGRPLVRLPRRIDRRLPERVVVVLDRSDRLATITFDQDRLIARLRRLLGPDRVSKWCFADGPESSLTVDIDRRSDGAVPFPKDKLLPLDVTALVLSDLGWHDAGAHAAWVRWIDAQRTRTRRIVALVPTVERRAVAASHAIPVEAWHDHASSPRPSGDDPQARASELLDHLAFTTDIDAEMLRNTRCVLAPRGFTIDDEIKARMRVVASDEVFGNSRGDLAARRTRFAKRFEDPTVDEVQDLSDIVDVVRRHRRGASPFIWHVEVLTIAGLVSEVVAKTVLEAGELEGSMAAIERVRASLERSELTAAAREEVGKYAGRNYPRLPDGTKDDPRLGAAFHDAFLLARDGGSRGDERIISIEQRSTALHASPHQEPASKGRNEPTSRSPLGDIRTSRTTLCLRRDLPPVRGVDRWEPTTGRWPDIKPKNQSLVVTTNLEEVSIAAFQRPVWASAVGRDGKGLWLEVGERSERIRFRWRPPERPESKEELKFGKWILEPETLPSWAKAAGVSEPHSAWADMEIHGVIQRFRWIPPGTFVMGSPPNEWGRDHDEEQHEVTLTCGYWLGETPVTQELWQAVMGANPSYFKTPDRPVETVSWDECEGFIEKINTGSDDGRLRLPTEAEWDHACRAGTTMATWAGDHAEKREFQSAILDRIAWYGGNSHEGFELENAYDLKKVYEEGWKELADDAPNVRCGSRPLKQKEANPWGLYDMLGNVWEWCSDWYAEETPRIERNLVGPQNGEARVLRGGAWYSPARYLRAAQRNALEPDGRDNVIGLRLARGQM